MSAEFNEVANLNNDATDMRKIESPDPEKYRMLDPTNKRSPGNSLNCTFNAQLTNDLS